MLLYVLICSYSPLGFISSYWEVTMMETFINDSKFLEDII